MNYGYMIIYKKSNNRIIYRATKTKPPYSKYEKTSMGWIVMDILRLYNGKTYSISDFDTLLARKHKWHDIFIQLDKTNLIDTLKLILLIVILYIIIVKF